MYDKWLTLLLLCGRITLIIGECACLNNGRCASDMTCHCQPGFYGVICSYYADAYQIEYVSTPRDVPKTLRRLNDSLKFYGYLPIDVERIAPGNIAKASFKQKLKERDLYKIRDIAQQAVNGETTVSAINDYDECSNGQKCYNEKKCVNNYGSFECQCEDGSEVENDKCVATGENTTITIYVWCGAVAGLLLLLIAILIYYHRRRAKKNKKIYKEASRRAAARKASHLSSLHFRPTSPPGSINTAFEIDDYKRPYPIHSEGSVYSYNSRFGVPEYNRGYAMSEPEYIGQRLPVPILDSFPNVNSDNLASRRFMSASEVGMDVYPGYAASDVPLYPPRVGRNAGTPSGNSSNDSSDTIDYRS